MKCFIPVERPIFVVDDNEADRDIIAFVLRKSKLQNEMVFLNDGQSAISQLTACNRVKDGWPALVLVDVNMPGVSGFDVLAWIREQSGASELPVVAMLTSSEAEQDKARARALGANHFLPKQSGIKSFVALINELFTNSPNAPRE